MLWIKLSNIILDYTPLYWYMIINNMTKFDSVYFHIIYKKKGVNLIDFEGMSSRLGLFYA